TFSAQVQRHLGRNSIQSAIAQHIQCRLGCWTSDGGVRLVLTSFLPSATASGPLRKPHSGKASPCETLGFFLLLFGLCRPSKLKKNTETPMLCHWQVVRTQPNSRVP